MPSITIYVDNTDDHSFTPNGFSIGHVFIKLEGSNLPAIESGKTASGYYGFYPATGNFIDGAGKIKDDVERYTSSSNTKGVFILQSETFTLSPEQYDAIKGYIQSQITSPDDYKISSNNCADFANYIYQLYNPSGNLGHVFSSSDLVFLEDTAVSIYIGEKFHNWKYIKLETDDFILDINAAIGTSIETIKSLNPWLQSRTISASSGKLETYVSVDSERPDTIIIPSDLGTKKRQLLVASEIGASLTVGNQDTIIIGMDRGAETVSYDNITGGIGVDVDLYAANTTLLNQPEIKDVFVKIENVTGSNYADQILGNAENNILTGLNGNDNLDGDIGNDIYDGGPGNDSTFDAAGIDTYLFKNGDQELHITDTGGQGTIQWNGEVVVSNDTTLLSKLNIAKLGLAIPLNPDVASKSPKQYILTGELGTVFVATLTTVNNKNTLTIQREPRDGDADDRIIVEDYHLGDFGIQLSVKENQYLNIINLPKGSRFVDLDGTFQYPSGKIDVESVTSPDGSQTYVVPADLSDTPYIYVIVNAGMDDLVVYEKSIVSIQGVAVPVFSGRGSLVESDTAYQLTTSDKTYFLILRQFPDKSTLLIFQDFETYSYFVATQSGNLVDINLALIGLQNKKSIVAIAHFQPGMMGIEGIEVAPESALTSTQVPIVKGSDDPVVTLESSDGKYDINFNLDLDSQVIRIVDSDGVGQIAINGYVVLDSNQPAKIEQMETNPRKFRLTVDSGNEFILEKELVNQKDLLLYDPDHPNYRIVIANYHKGMFGVTDIPEEPIKRAELNLDNAEDSIQSLWQQHKSGYVILIYAEGKMQEYNVDFFAKSPTTYRPAYMRLSPLEIHDFYPTYEMSFSKSGTTIQADFYSVEGNITINLNTLTATISGNSAEVHEGNYKIVTPDVIITNGKYTSVTSSSHNVTVASSREDGSILDFKGGGGANTIWFQKGKVFVKDYNKKSKLLIGDYDQTTVSKADGVSGEVTQVKDGVYNLDTRNHTLTLEYRNGNLYISERVRDFITITDFHNGMFGITGIVEAQELTATSIDITSSAYVVSTTDMRDYQTLITNAPSPARTQPTYLTADLTSGLMIGVLLLRIGKHSGGWAKHVLTEIRSSREHS